MKIASSRPGFSPFTYWRHVNKVYDEVYDDDERFGKSVQFVTVISTAVSQN